MGKKVLIIPMNDPIDDSLWRLLQSREMEIVKCKDIPRLIKELQPTSVSDARVGLVLLHPDALLSITRQQKDALTYNYLDIPFALLQLDSASAETVQTFENICRIRPNKVLLYLEKWNELELQNNLLF